MSSKSYRTPFVLLVVLFQSGFSFAALADDLRSRRIEFTYSGAINEIPAGARVRAWLPIAQNSEHQRIHNVEWTHFADQETLTHDPVHANRMLYLERVTDAAGPLEFEIKYDLTRYEIRALDDPKPYVRIRSAARERMLSANRLVPIDGVPLQLLQGTDLSNDPLVRAREIYDIVDGHMRYDKSQPGYGNGDVVWACNSGTGNCTDFHSLFMSLARSRDLPAFFEIGFPIPEPIGAGQIGGYHCWASCHVPGYGWVPVDISEADKAPSKKDYYFGNLSENRISFSVGRDIRLSPEPAQTSLNYFIYPHVEVDGEPCPADRLQMEFRYRDIENE